MTARDDVALLQQSMPTGAEGIRALEKFTRDGNAEVRKLLYEECTVLYECRYCRNVFRNPKVFTEHKRAFCRPSHVGVVPEAAQADEPSSSGTSTRRSRTQAGQGSSKNANAPPPQQQQTTYVPLAQSAAIMEMLRVIEEEGIDKLFEDLPPVLNVNTHIPPRETTPPPQDDETSEEERNIRRDEEMRRARLRKKKMSDLRQKDSKTAEQEKKKEEKESNKSKSGSSSKNEINQGKTRGSSAQRKELEKVEEKKGWKKIEKKEEKKVEKKEEKKIEKKEEKKVERKEEKKIEKKLEKKEEKKVEKKEDKKVEKDGKKEERKVEKKDEKMIDEKVEQWFVPASPEKRQRKRPAWMNEEEMYEEMARLKTSEQSSSSTKDNSAKDKSGKPEKKKAKEADSMPPLVPQYVLPVTPTKDEKEKSSSREKEVMFYTPRAGQIQQERMKEAGEASKSRRKQNLSALADESDEIMIIDVSDEMSTKKRSDIALMPVFLSNNQEKIFFSGLLTLDKVEGSPFRYECMYCRKQMRNIDEGRRHMVSHVRVMRLRCGLCGVGAFFGIDMRNHLMNRGCPELSKAPAHMIKAGIPCMSKQDANELTFVAHPTQPGKVVMTSGKIVSITSNKPYVPDLRIEEQMLQPSRVAPAHYSPRKPTLVNRFVDLTTGKNNESSGESKPSTSGTSEAATTQGNTDDAASADSSKSSN